MVTQFAWGQVANERRSAKVVVVGAGISGLAAADHLKQQGVDVLVLEAQDLIGGRIKTNHSLDIPFDEGASWIHGPKGNPITTLAKKAMITTYHTDDESAKVYDIDGSEYGEKQLRKAGKQYNKLLSKLEGEEGKSLGALVDERYLQGEKKSRLWTYMLSAFLEFDTGADLYRLSSTHFYDDEAFRGEDVIVTNGYDRLIQYLAKNVDIHVNTVVNGIDYSGDSISLLTNQGMYSADQVIVTVPLGVLQKGSIHFAPALPKTKTQALAALEMGVVNKFLLVWDQPFWDKNIQYIGFTPAEKSMFNYFLNVHTYTDVPALMTFAFGDYAIETERMSDMEVQQVIMKHLMQIYGSDIPEPNKFLRTKWASHPYTHGSYTFVGKNGTSEAFEVVAKPVAGKLFFAGEHCSSDYRGTVHGAYLSGLNAATLLLKN